MNIIIKTAGTSLLLMALLALAGGCAGPQYITDSLDTPGATLSVVAAPPVQDGRARFRELFCGVLSADAEFGRGPSPCDRYLWKLQDESAPAGSPGSMPVHDTRFKILFVSGLFSECAWRTRKPFETAAERLRRLGYDADWLSINGVSGADYNADRIASEIAGLDRAKDQFMILVGHSKGTVDILHFLVNHPHLAPKVSAVISVAGAVNGSPLADYLHGVGSGLFRSVPAWVCPSGDDRALKSLQRSVRMKWIAEHPLPGSVRYFSIVGYTRRDNISAGLAGTYDRLRTIHPRNDGLLLYYDQVIPGSTLLGYANADHWAIAMPAGESGFLGKGLMNKNRYPRASLVEAAILYVIESLAAAGKAPYDAAGSRQ